MPPPLCPREASEILSASGARLTGDFKVSGPGCQHQHFCRQSSNSEVPIQNGSIASMAGACGQQLQALQSWKAVRCRERFQVTAGHGSFPALDTEMVIFRGGSLPMFAEASLLDFVKEKTPSEGLALRPALNMGISPNLVGNVRRQQAPLAARGSCGNLHPLLSG